MRLLINKTKKAHQNLFGTSADPIITYDHMSENNDEKELSSTLSYKKNKLKAFVIEEMILLAMGAWCFYLCL